METKDGEGNRNMETGDESGGSKDEGGFEIKIGNEDQEARDWEEGKQEYRRLIGRDSLLTPPQLAEQLQLSLGTIYYWVSRREIPFIKLGKHLRFELTSVLAHFMAHTRDGKKGPPGLARFVVVKKKDRSLTTRDPDHAELREKE